MDDSDTTTDESTLLDSLNSDWQFESGDELIRDESCQFALLDNEFISPDLYIVKRRLLDLDEGVAYYQINDTVNDNTFLRRAENVHSLYQAKPDPSATGPQAA